MAALPELAGCNALKCLKRVLKSGKLTLYDPQITNYLLLTSDLGINSVYQLILRGDQLRDDPSHIDRSISSRTSGRDRH